MAAKELSAKDAFREAYARIEHAKSIGEKSLNFKDLGNLDRLPDNIVDIPNIGRLNISGTKISDVDVLSKCKSVSFFDADGSLIIDISGLQGMTGLFSFSASDSPLEDISPLSASDGIFSLTLKRCPVKSIDVLKNFRGLNFVDLSGTKIDNIDALSGIETLKIVDISDTDVSDLRPLSEISELGSLSIKRTKVSDLSPLKNTPSLFSQGAVGGIDIDGANQLPEEIRNLSDLPHPLRSMRVYSVISGGSFPELNTEEEQVTESQLSQRPAPYAFEVVKGIVNVSAIKANIDHPDLIDEIKPLVVEKIQLALNHLHGNESDPNLESTIKSIAQELMVNSLAMREGVILMRFRTLQAVATTYGTSEHGRSEAVRSAVIDLSTSLEDLISLLPGVRRIDANRQALQFQSDERSVALLQKQIDEISNSAKVSGIVSQDAIKAISDGTKEVAMLSDVIRFTPSDAARAVAIERQANIAGLQALGIRNFAAAPIKFLVKELGPVLTESWSAAKVAVPKGVGSGVESVVAAGIRSAPALLVASLVGPLSGMMMLAASFAPLMRIASRVRTAIDESGNDDESASDSNN